MTHIHFILTGGTIDKAYNPADERPMPNAESVIPAYMRDTIKPHGEITFETICMVDSLDMTQDMEQQIAAAADKAKADKIVIVCGTSRMADIAAKCDAANDKTIVFTGAMIPLKEFPMSDGGFNLGYALSQAQTLPAGTYICMNAHTFKTGEVIKDVAASRFEALT
ncbi:MAG: asparaginase [Micavibrio sp.]|nr:asparaginase [Micavibrio sp.]